MSMATAPEVSAAEPASAPPHEAETDTEPLDHAFARFLGALRRARRRAPAGDSGLTLAQLHLVGELYDHPGHTVRELADATGVTQPTVTRALDALQRQGLLRRVASPEDRRCVLVELTDDGRTVLVAERARIDARRHELLAELSGDERAQAERLLLRLADLVERL
jgi:DNA-binding MarR family transcriptional regulator